jgi:superfamily II DNA/RNA helicase
MSDLLTQIEKDLKSGKSILTTCDELKESDFLSKLISHFVPHAEEGSPRVLLLFADDEKARTTGEFLKKSLRHLDLTVDVIVEKGNKLQQRNDLFDGTEIIVGSTKRICELYFQNGFNINKLKFFAAFDLNEQFRKSWRGQIIRIMESLPKSRIVLHGTNLDDERMEALLELVNDNLLIYE